MMTALEIYGAFGALIVALTVDGCFIRPTTSGRSYPWFVHALALFAIFLAWPIMVFWFFIDVRERLR